MYDPNNVFLLLVDDDPDFRESAARRFIRRGYQVQEAATGRDGLELCEQVEFDVVVLDVVMPEMTGIEMLEKLKVYYPECEAILAHWKRGNRSRPGGQSRVGPSMVGRLPKDVSVYLSRSNRIAPIAKSATPNRTIDDVQPTGWRILQGPDHSSDRQRLGAVRRRDPSRSRRWTTDLLLLR